MGGVLTKNAEVLRHFLYNDEQTLLKKETATTTTIPIYILTSYIPKNIKI